jgi:hypothetical protein
VGIDFRTGAAKTAAVALLCAIALLVTAASALGARTHSFLGTVGGGELTAAAGLAVDQADGDLYVADAGAGSIFRYDEAGAPAEFASLGGNQLGGFGFEAGTSSQVAVDNSGGAKAGDFYVAANGVVSAYEPDGEPAPFTAAVPNVSANTLTGLPSSPFARVLGVTVDPTGAIYVSDGGSFDVFSPEGEYLTSFGAFEAIGIAGDSSGDVYTAALYGEPNGYAPSELPVTAATTYAQSILTAAPKGEGIGVDLATDDVYDVLGGEVVQLGPLAAGNERIVAFGAGRLAGASGIAVDSSGGPHSGDVYVADGGHVARFGPLVNAPGVVTAAPTAVDSAAKSATLNGTVDPEGEAVTECAFEYGTGGAFDQVAPCAESGSAIGTGNAPVAVHADLAGLAVGDYEFRLAAAGPEGRAEGAARAFVISGVPAVVSESAQADPTGATLGASIDTGNATTTYRFEYGLTSAYGSVTATGTTPAALAPSAVSISVAGLQPGTTYHYRALATNYLGTAGGADQTFTTPTAGGAGGCPNEALRTGLSALLPDCRAYEMVSPVDKQGGGVYEEGNVQAAADGHGIAYLSINPFADAPAKPLISTYVGTREAAGWSTHSPDAPQYVGGSIDEINTAAYDANLTEALVTSRLALAPGAIEHGSNLYLRDVATGAYTLVAAVPGERAYFNWSQGQRVYAGGSPDFSRVIVKSEAIKLQGEGVESFTGANLYAFADGHLGLISTLPDGEAVPARVPQGVDFVSEDGNRVYFLGQVEGGSALFLSEPGKPTVAVSSFEGTTVAPLESRASANGRFAYFTAATGLLSDPFSALPPTLYRFDADTGAVTEVVGSPSPEGPHVQAILGTSADGSYVYFTAIGAVEGFPEPPGEEGAAYVWHDGTVRLVATTEAGANERYGPATGSVSEDGRYFAFPSRSLLTPDARPGGCPVTPAEPSGNCSELFEYSYASSGLECASCGGTPSGTSYIAAPRPLFSEYTAHALFDNGALFFNTKNPISPRDSNGKVDVYEWNHGRASLISSGSGEGDAIFADAWAEPGSGAVRDVYFRTTQGLVGQDTDGRLDLYDARIDGGLAGQNPGAAPSPCSGEACRGPSPGPPPPAAGSSAGGRCEAAIAKARNASRRVTTLAHRVHKAKGKKQRGHLRRQVAAARKQAKKLNRQSNTCRRQGR